MNDELDAQSAPADGAEPHSTRDDAAGSTPGAREAELTADVARLSDQLLRALAETENTRRRLEQQADERGRYAISAFARDMLAVADNLRRAIDNIPADKLAADELAGKLAEGVELTERVLIAALERYGVKRIASVGLRFDPHLHQAMMEVESDTAPPGTIVHEMQPGYTIHDRLLRPAMVSIAKAGAGIQPGAAGVDTKV